MDTSKIFNEFLDNIKVENAEDIIKRFKKITKRLNTDFHEIEKDDENSLYVGSFGRDTAINKISDLDINFIMPDNCFTSYDNRESNGQSALLQDVKKSLEKTYSQSKVRGDGQVVVIEFTNDFIEVCPVFQENDGSFTYPDSNKGGSWKKTDPQPEIDEIEAFDLQTNGNLKALCRMSRAWKNKMGVKIGGLLIDTLVYNFLKSDEKYHTYTYNEYDFLVRDFFEYLKDLDDDRTYWHSPGSNQQVYKKKSNFKSKSKKAFKIVEEAISNSENDDVYEDWQKVFGKVFPYPQNLYESSTNYTSNEQFIEQFYPINIKYKLRLNCEVSQNGFRLMFLRDLIDRLRKKKKLRFFIEFTDVPEPYDVLWKVKNEGQIAKSLNNFRGEVIRSNSGSSERTETTSFEGEHFVECYIIKDGFCVARDRIDVPISNFE